MKKNRILITGGSGLLALNWAYAMRDKHLITLGLHQRKISLIGAQTVLLNLESLDNLSRQFEVLHPEIVIHTAGLTSVEKCQFDPVLAHQLNIILATNIAKICAMFKVPLIHISTDHLYSGHSSFADESLLTSPANVYGSTKAEAELRVLDENPEALVIRTNFFGWGTNYRQSFSDLIIDRLREKKEIELFDDVFYTPILIGVLAQAAHDLIAMNAKGIFNIVGGQRISKLTFGVTLAQVFGLDDALIKPTQIAMKSLLVKRPLDMSLSNKKAVNFLGRELGTIEDYLSQLRQLEKDGMAKEFGNL
jgi:dTDP-4-dehydrorhamnose reductase